MKQRTIDNMHIAASRKAHRLWEVMQTEFDGSAFAAARDEYYAMFKDDRNFTKNTEPYRPAA